MDVVSPPDFSIQDLPDYTNSHLTSKLGSKQPKKLTFRINSHCDNFNTLL